MTERTVRPWKSEVADLRSAMRDVQVSIAAYHNATAGFQSDSEAFETPAKATVAFIQKVNDVLRTQIGSSNRYRRIFKRELDVGHSGPEMIEAFRYVRNVTTHQLFRVSPATTAVVGGLGLGYITAACWGPIPRRVDNRLHVQTRALKTYYDRHLVDHLVIDTFLDSAKYLATICPMIVHRDHAQEWTGFPLRSQPGVSTRLHPAEPPLVYGNPTSQKKNARWLNKRVPGGDFRAICGRATIGGRDVLFGLTFRGLVSLSPFVETAQQVSLDVDAGYLYYHCSDSSHLRYDALGPYRHGDTIACVVSDVALSEWTGNPVKSITHIDPFVTFMTREQWSHQVRIDLTDHLVRRSQRLAAVYPPM